MSQEQYQSLISNLLKEKHALTKLRAEIKGSITNFIQSYLHQIFDDSHSLKASLKPLRRPFDQCQLCLEAINNGWDIKQINW